VLLSPKGYELLFHVDGGFRVVTPMPRNTVAEVLECFDDEFAEVAAAFARGEYLLWLGSGISRGVVPDVPTLLRRILEFLQTSIDVSNPGCPFRVALAEVLDAAGAAAAAVDLTTEVSSWANLSEIIDRLGSQYSHVLDVRVDGESADYLVWSVLDVPSTYGAPDLEPDVEHLCVAILMLEGVVQSAPTTNWDGLVEKAMERLSGGSDSVLKVVVRADDFRAPDRRAELVKFHGCAVRAAQDPDEYRKRLIARISQISGWTEKSENEMMKTVSGTCSDHDPLSSSGCRRKMPTSKRCSTRRSKTCREPGPPLRRRSSSPNTIFASITGW
jgi:hypothetical protein